MQGHKLVLGHNPTGLGMNLLPATAQAAAPMGSQRVDWTSHFPARFLQPQHSAGSSALSTETAQHPHADSHHDVRSSLADNRAAAAARPMSTSPTTQRQLLQASRAGPHAQQLLHAMHAQSLQLQEEPLPAPAAELQPAQLPAHQHMQQEQDADMADAAPAPAAGPAEQQLEGQDSAVGLDLLMLVIQAAEKADAEQAAGPQPQQHDPAAALLAACASAQEQDGVPFSPLPVPMQEDQAHLEAAAADTLGLAGNTGYAAAGQDNMDAAARDAHMRHAVAATLAAVQSRAAQQAAAGPVTRSRDSSAQAGPSNRPKRAAAVEGEILRTVMLQEEAASKGQGRRCSSHSSSNSSCQRVSDRLKSLELAAQLHQQREQHQLAGRPPLPNKKRRSSSPDAPVGRCGSDGVASLHAAQHSAAGLLDPAATEAGTAAAACAGGNPGRAAGRKAAGNAGSKPLNTAGSGSAAATDPQIQALAASLQAAAAARAAATRAQSQAAAASRPASAAAQVARAAATAVFVPPAAPCSPAAKGAKASLPKAPGAAKHCSHPAPKQALPAWLAAKAAAAVSAAAQEDAATPAQPGAASAHTSGGTFPFSSAARQPQPAAAGPAAADEAAMQRAAAGRPPRRSAAARASQQIAATGGPKSTLPAAAVSASHKRNQAAAGTKAFSLPASRGSAAAAGSKGKSRAGRPAAQAAAASSSSSSSDEEDDSDDPTSTSGSSGGSDNTSDSDTEFRAASRKSGAAKRSRPPRSKPAAVGPQFTTNEDGVVVVAAGKRGPKGGRPLGAGNRNEMQPRSVNSNGEAAYGCRSQSFRGVYKCQRMTVRWRTQFSYARKVLNVGSYETEEDAARAWNAAAMHFRGGGCWVNPVEPVLPEDQGLAIAASLPQPEGGSLLPAAINTAG